MHAVLAISASHLRYLQPGDPSHRTAELLYLSKAYTGLCDALSAPPTHSNSSALISCSLLILHNAWNSINSNESQANSAFDMRVDHLFPLSSGLRSVLEATLHVRQPEFFTADRANETLHLVQPSLSDAQESSNIRQIFINVYSCVTEPVSVHSQAFATYLDGASWLIPVFPLLPTRGTCDGTDNFLAGIMRYLFLWPVRFQEGLRLLNVQNRAASRVLIFFFYKAVSMLVSERVWWAQERSCHFREALQAELGNDVSQLVLYMDRFCHND